MQKLPSSLTFQSVLRASRATIRNVAIAALVAAIAATGMAENAFAQTAAPPAAAPPAAAPPAVAPPAVAPPAVAPPAAAPPAAAAEEPAADVREMSVTTDDGVDLKFSYYPADVEESVPIILLHGGGGSRDDLRSVALYLQAQGHSVVLPDLRGHGDSTSQTRGGQAVVLKYNTQNRNDIAAMVMHDMTKLWNFLLKENNNKAVNVKKLCVVGVDMGAIVALNFTAKNYVEKDWRNQPRGKDVKALVLVSPPKAYRGASYVEAVRQPAFKGEVASLIAVGEQGSAERSAAGQLEGMLSKYAESGAKNKKEKLVLYANLPTKLQGAELLSNQQLKLSAAVDGFIKKYLVEKAIAWKEQIAF
jgi:pimeloyl-ACP methyl ester carboxylesterase